MDQYGMQIHGICDWKGERESSYCGYCKNMKTKPQVSMGAEITSCSCSFYDEIMMKNWDRDANYYYQPQNDKACCPQYTNRLKAFEFKMSSSYRKVLKRVDHWLKTGERNLSKQKSRTKRKNQTQPSLNTTEIERVIDGAIISLQRKELIPKIESVRVSIKLNRKTKGIDIEKYQLSCPVAFQIFGLLKKSNSKIDLSPHELAKLIANESNNIYEDHQNIFSEIIPHSSGFLHISIPKENFTDQKSEEKEDDEEEEFIIETDEIVEESIITQLVPSEFTEEIYELFVKYQVNVHKEEESQNTRETCKRFLCQSSLIREENTNDDKPLSVGYGTYHFLYRLQKSNKLIAFSYLDILPSGVVSIYFVYDPDYRFLELGKYSILYEIQTMFLNNKQKIQNNFPKFQYYYLGFYVHDCPKMNYKSQYKPQEILCNETWKWVDLHKHAIPKLQTNINDFFSSYLSNYVRFYPKEEELEEKKEKEDEEEEEGEGEMIFVKYERKVKEKEERRDCLVLYNDQLARRSMFTGEIFGKLTFEAERRMDEYLEYLGDWSDKLAFLVKDEDIEKEEKEVIDDDYIDDQYINDIVNNISM